MPRAIAGTLAGATLLSVLAQLALSGIAPVPQGAQEEGPRLLGWACRQARGGGGRARGANKPMKAQALLQLRLLATFSSPSSSPLYPSWTSSSSFWLYCCRRPTICRLHCEHTAKHDNNDDADDNDAEQRPRGKDGVLVATSFEECFRDKGWAWAAWITAVGEVLLLPLVVLVSFLPQPELFAALAEDRLIPEVPAPFSPLFKNWFEIFIFGYNFFMSKFKFFKIRAEKI